MQADPNIIGVVFANVFYLFRACTQNKTQQPCMLSSCEWEKFETVFSHLLKIIYVSREFHFLQLNHLFIYHHSPYMYANTIYAECMLWISESLSNAWISIYVFFSLNTYDLFVFHNLSHNHPLGPHPYGRTIWRILLYFSHVCNTFNEYVPTSTPRTWDSDNVHNTY